jgi:membrane protease YdiL (CAAX protease family)
VNLNSQNEEKIVVKSSKKWLYIIGLIIVLGSEFILRDIFLPEYAQDVHIKTIVLMEWLILLSLLVFWIPRIEGNKLESIGFGKVKWRYLWVATLTYIILLMAWFCSSFALKSVGLEGLRSLQPLLKEYSFSTLLSLFFTGAFLEEIFYRGYMIERLALLTGKSWLAGLISWAAFTFVHLKFFGLGPTLEVGILSVGLVVLYLKERSIWPCFIVHGMNDAFGFLVAPLIT